MCVLPPTVCVCKLDIFNYVCKLDFVNGVCKLDVLNCDCGTISLYESLHCELACCRVGRDIVLFVSWVITARYVC